MLDGFIASSSHARRSIHSLFEHPLVPTFITPRHCQSRDLILEVFQSCISRARSNSTGLPVSAIAFFLSPPKKDAGLGADRDSFLDTLLYLSQSLSTTVYLLLPLLISNYPNYLLLPLLISNYPNYL